MRFVLLLFKSNLVLLISLRIELTNFLKKIELSFLSFFVFEHKNVDFRFYKTQEMCDFIPNHMEIILFNIANGYLHGQKAV